MRYNEDLFSKVMGFPCSGVIECNMKETHIEYYKDSYNESYPYEISKQDLQNKCFSFGLTIKDLQDLSVDKSFF